MNNNRRRQIAQAADLIETAITTTTKETFLSLIGRADTLVSQALDGEQDYLDNMPDSFADGERGDVAREAIGQLEVAQAELADAIERQSFSDDAADLLEALEEAQA